MRAPLGCAIAIIGLALSSPAYAYCFSAACPGEFPGICNPPSAVDCTGAPVLRWTRRCVGFAVQEDGSSSVALSDAVAALEASFATWQQADCGNGATPGIQITYLGRVGCDRVEYNKQEGNANVLVFRDGTWPHEMGGHNLALTTTTYDPDSGALVDADIEVNTASFAFSLSDPTEVYDLQGILTHEAGHFLGLAHSFEPDATMIPSTAPGPGTLELRTLAADDMAGICAAYPPDGYPGEDCNPIPKHGFSPDCRGEQLEGDCSIAKRPTTPRPVWLPLVAAFALVRLVSARRRSGRRRLSSRR